MAAKNNIRSIRFSDELAELINRQIGDNFSQKFENLVKVSAWELPARQSELKQLEERIQEKKKQLQQMTIRAGELNMTLNDLTRKAKDLNDSIQRAAEKWNT